MGLSLVTGPALEPILLAEAKAHCRIDSSDDDAVVAGYIVAARRYAESTLRRVLMNQTWDHTVDHYWPCGHEIELPLQPVLSVTSFSCIDTSGATQVLTATTDYLVRSGKDQIGMVYSAYNVVWPAIRCQRAAATVRYVAGYGTNPGDVPEEIRQAILLHVELLYDRDPGARENLERARDSLLSPYRYI